MAIRKVPHPTRCIAFLIIAMAASGCSNLGEGQRSTRPPADFRMHFGKGGGFTGAWDGFTIEGDGTVYHWSGLVTSTKNERIGRLSARQLQDLWTQVDRTAFFDRDLHETGNITSFIEIRADGRTSRLSWIPGIENIDPPAHPVEELYTYGRDLARKASRE